MAYADPAIGRARDRERFRKRTAERVDYASCCTSILRRSAISGIGCRRESHRPCYLVGGVSGISNGQ